MVKRPTVRYDNTKIRQARCHRLTQAETCGIISAVPLAEQTPGPDLSRDVRERRSERAGEAEQATRFRSIRDRTSADQLDAVAAGYTSVEQLAIDELGRAYHRLNERIDKLERDVEAFLGG